MTTRKRALIVAGIVVVAGHLSLFLAWQNAIGTAADYRARVELAQGRIARLDSQLYSQWRRADSLEHVVINRDVRIDSLHVASEIARMRVRDALAALDTRMDFSDETDSALVARLRGAFRLRTDH